MSDAQSIDLAAVRAIADDLSNASSAALLALPCSSLVAPEGFPCDAEEQVRADLRRGEALFAEVSHKVESTASNLRVHCVAVRISDLLQLGSLTAPG